VVFLAAFNGFNCFQMPSDPPSLANLNLRRAVALTSLLSMTLNNIGQLPAFLAQREVASKHVKMRLFRPSSFVLADFLVSIPFSCTEVCPAPPRPTLPHYLCLHWPVLHCPSVGCIWAT